MNSESDHARMIAEKVARRLAKDFTPTTVGTNAANDISAELAALRASLSEMQNRLIQIESKVRSTTSSNSSVSTPNNPRTPITHSPWLAGVNADFAHPSQERFGVEEATVSELVDFFQNEKTCSVEPGGKPCDHCAMCSSRGF
ncbi:MAG: hypothetical protein ABR555_03300 [Pyrinomonadaceae bacterium]